MGLLKIAAVVAATLFAVHACGGSLNGSGPASTGPGIGERVDQGFSDFLDRCCSGNHPLTVNGTP